MTARMTVTVDVMRYADGVKVGTVEMDAAEWEQYAACEHPAYQWPEGIARVGDVLTCEEIEKMGIGADTTVWLD